jgi:hypothetical protein
VGSVSRFESLVDRQIRLAQERGEFDDLPGMGKPLPGWGGQDDEDWWLKNYLQREGLSSEALLPTSLRLAREIERLPDRARGLMSEQAVREAAQVLNGQIADYLRAPSGPYVPLRPVDINALLEQWRAYAGKPRAEPPGGGEPTPGRRRWFRRRSTGS